jgi:hypothetical protein
MTPLTPYEWSIIRAVGTALLQGSLILATYELWAYLLAAMPAR